MLIVIPTARSISLENLRPLIEDGARFIVVDDSEGTVVVNHPQFQTYNWTDQKRMLGSDVIAIPRRNGACRDFGFYVAWRESGPDEIVIALDDDVLVEHDFGRSVEAVLSSAPRPIPEVLRLKRMPCPDNRRLKRTSRPCALRHEN
jgi:reversibly glycosylated polypeptide